MALKIIVVVFAVFCLIPANGNIIIKSAEEEKLMDDETEINQESEGQVSKRGFAAIIPLVELGITVLQKVLDTLGNIGRTTAIGIGNDTPYEWKADGVYFRSGTSDEILPIYLSSDEGVIFPARKTEGPVATGVVGVLCYYIPERSKSLCVMFSVPFDYNLYSNWWDVQMFSGKVSPSQALYERMYYGNPYRGDNRYHEKDLGFGFIMEHGIMTSGGQAKLMLNIAMKSK